MRRVLAGLALLVLSTTTSLAATLDFTSLGSGAIGSTTGHIAGADVVSLGTDLFVGAGGHGPNSICAYGGSRCYNDLQISFASPVYNLKLDSFGLDAGDAVNILVYGAANSLLGNFSFGFADGVLDYHSCDRRGCNVEVRKIGIDLSGFGLIERLFFDDLGSTGAGVAYANFDFDVAVIPPVAAVPLPATLPMLLSGLGAIGLIAARRRKSRA